MESSGVELRINGRAIEHGMFDRVWGEAIHPSQNRFLVQVDPDYGQFRRTACHEKEYKTSFCEADPRLKQAVPLDRNLCPCTAQRRGHH